MFNLFKQSKMKSVLLLPLFFMFFNISTCGSTIHYLEPGETYDKKLSGNDFQIFCYKGRPKYIIHIWHSVSLELGQKNDNYLYYVGETPEQVEEEYRAQHSSWSFNFFSWKVKRFKVDPFAQTCIGIESSEPYSVYLQIIRIDYWKILLLLTGILLFFYAPVLSSNSMFYYLCGIAIGIVASFLILIYFVSKLFPKKPMMYGFVVGGWTVGVYIIQMLWENFRVILTVYNKYLLWYTLVSGFISFVFCYYWGPVQSPRTKNLLKWTLQALSFFMIYYSSHFQEAAMGIIVLILLIYNIPQTWISKSRTYWKRKFPPKAKLLSNDEYYQQGVRETARALEELRVFCSSPKCNQWNTVLKLHDAKRFASFVEGNSHLTDEEILEYENESLHRTELTDDEDLRDDLDVHDALFL